MNPPVNAHFLRGALILLSLLSFSREIYCQATPTPTATPTGTPSATPTATETPSPTPTPTPTPISIGCVIPPPGRCVSYEAESDINTLRGSAFILDCPTCSGGLKVGYVGNNDGTLQFNAVGVVATGNYSVTICYLNGDAERHALLSINGGPGMPLDFPSTGSFQTLGSIQITVFLTTGCNTLEFYNPIVGDWAPDFDRITFNCPTCTVPSPTPIPSPTATPTTTPVPTATPEEGCYPNFTTAEGCAALFSLTTGSANTALGWRVLSSDTIGNFNTGVGGGALPLNNMDSNSAVGAAALLLHVRGIQNTAVGSNALMFNGSGDVSGDANTAIGYSALMNNVTGGANTAAGWEALMANVAAHENVALGNLALSRNVSGNNNTIIGRRALENGVATNNHVVVGTMAGSGITIVDNNIIIGHHSGVHSRFLQENNVCYIGRPVSAIGGHGNIYGANVDNADDVARMVFVDPDGRLGTIPVSSATPTPTPPDGNPDKSGMQPQPIPDAGKQVMVDLELQRLDATISEQRHQIEILTAQIKEQIAEIQEVNARIDANKPTAKTIANEPKAVP